MTTVMLGRSLVLTVVVAATAVLSGCGDSATTSASTAADPAAVKANQAAANRAMSDTWSHGFRLNGSDPTHAVGTSPSTSTAPSKSTSTSTTGTPSTSSSSGTHSTPTSSQSSSAGSGSTAAATAVNPLGINLAAVAYWSPEQPFLNLMKSAGASSNLSTETGWYTSSNKIWDTGEEAHLQLDSDGYPTSLSAAAAPAGGQQFTYVQTLLNYSQPKGSPGQVYAYPPGTYRLKFEGQGTVKVAGDAAYASGNTCPSSLALSNSGANAYVSCTFTVSTPGQGIILEITAIASSTDHPRDISVVQNTYAADYDAGAVFNPAFIAALNGFSNLRFMDWMDTNGEFAGYTAAASIPAGATSFSLSSEWILPSGTYSILFIDGERRAATFTLGSASVSWSGGLANAISEANNWTWGSQSSGSTFYVINKSWANRSVPSNAFWSLHAGVPLEAIVALCNELKANCHLNVPMMYSDADIEAMGQLVMSGTGMQSGFSALTPASTASFELSNEVWNPTYVQYDVAGSLGGLNWPAQLSGGGNYQWNRNYFGMRTAQMASDLDTAVGTSLFSRVIPVLAAQAAGTYSASYALQTPYWTAGPASRYPIKAIAIAPYWGNNPSASDCAAMTGQGDGGLADFFATLTSQSGASGHAYASVPSGGYLGQVEGWIAAYVAAMANYPSMKLITYEGGQNFYATTAGTCAAWPSLVASAERDSRMGNAYSAYLNYWQSKVGNTAANVNNLYNDVTPISGYGAWGLMESVMQTIEPLTSAPAKYQAAVNYLAR